MTPRAIIIGGSLGGLFAGLLLRRAGWQVEIHERNGAELGARGAGIVTHPALHQILELATGEKQKLGVEVPGRVVLAQDGSLVCEAAHPQILASWDQVWKRLRNHADTLYHYGRTLTHVTQEADSATAHFADGSSAKGTIIVAADGIQSVIRRQLMPDVQPAYAGYIAWRGLVSEEQVSEATRVRLFDRFGFCLPPSEQMLGYPVDGGTGARLRYNYVWYRPADSATELPRLLTGSDGKHYHGGIPPHLLHPAVLSEMRAAAARLLAPAFADVVAATPQPLMQPIVDLEVSHMRLGRVVLIGDAAFVARPHVGMGVTKAAEDALALAQAVAGNHSVDEALDQFSRERTAVGQRIIRRARQLGAYMQAQQLSDVERQAAQMHRKPEAVMSETATTLGIELW